MSNQVLTDPRGHALRLKRHGLLVRTKAREYALEHAANVKRMSNGQPRYTRVSEAWLDRINARLELIIQTEVESLPSNGRTI